MTKQYKASREERETCEIKRPFTCIELWPNNAHAWCETCFVKYVSKQLPTKR